MTMLPVLWHLGALHGYEKVLVLVIAFGPFVVLSFVVRYARRRDLAVEEAERAAAARDGSEVSGRPPTT